MLMILSIYSIPSRLLYDPSRIEERITRLEMAGYNTSDKRVLFPEPETPVMHTNLPRGILTSIFLRLCSLAPLRAIQAPFPFRRTAGTSILRDPARYCPVMLWGLAATSCTLP